MWTDSGQDPGGSGGAGPPPQPASSQELADLKDQFEQQQVLISQLKEMLRKSEPTKATQEKVEEFASTLSKMNARAKRSKLNKKGENEQKSESVGTPDNRKQVDTPATEKINLLRQQMEENKVKLAERGKNQRGIEEMVIQLRAQLDDSQNLMNQSPLNLSLAEAKIESYSADTSSQELYKILLVKEKRVSELLTKVQKLEGNVLDLQENIKEKDQVIDARTKAITLMSENLSKKGKHTLDMLDETKEQMRKMQENFIQLESDMKEEKQKLVNELQQKNAELHDLKEANLMTENLDVENYKEQIEELLRKIKELEDSSASLSVEKSAVATENDEKLELQKALEEAKKANEKYASKITELEGIIQELNAPASKSEDFLVDHEEIAKLKKQLDESNKNMIKVKAQHKSKIRELTKKVDTFKQVSDVNAEIVRLDTENGKMEKKITELQQEREKLLAQLEESNSAKEYTTAEEVKELERKIEELSQQLIEKQNEIAGLTQKAELSETEVAKLTEQLANFSHLQNAQVTSELDSIAFEEQLDKVEAEKREILEEKESIIEENTELLEKLEVLRKEKQEISQKLDSYMQENMDLIDRLEKLSAEKVSSAESIEMVESLTQQERLELEAYQKQIDLMAENIKNSQENLDQNTELNESVNQLTEETSELLQKIELFTIERREVMDKMEMLTSENNHLNTKVKEIENNRDVLAETYEQLQNEKEELDSKLLKLEEEHGLLLDKLKMLEDENDHLQGTDGFEKQNYELSSANEKLERELHDMRQQIIERDELLTRKSEEISNYESIVEENRSELISTSNSINELHTKLSEQDDEVSTLRNETSHLNSVITDLNGAISQLEAENINMAQGNESVIVMEKQLHELKQLLGENIEQMRAYEKEMEENSKTISELKNELDRLNDALLQMEHALHSKDDEIKKLLKDRDNKETVISNLQEELQSKNENFHETCNKLKEKCKRMAEQITQNTGSIENIRQPLEARIEELTTKNREQLEKMKKIAANLKKKTTAYQELEEKYTEVNEKWETESKGKKELKSAVESKDLQIVESEKKIHSLIQQLHEVEDELSSVQNNFDNKVKDYDLLLEQFNSFKENKTQMDYVAAQENLQHRLRQYENQMAEMLNVNEMLHSQEHNTYNAELSAKDDHIESLQRNSNALQAKINELEMYTETQDAELNKFKERVNKLEEGLSVVEERRMSLERKAIELGAQLEEKSSSFEEISQAEDLLEDRLHALTLHDEAIQRRLQETNAQNQELMNQNHLLTEQNVELRHKVDLAHNKVSELNASADRLAKIESENVQLKALTNDLDSHLKHLQQALDEKKQELDNADLDLQEHLRQLNEERKGLLEQVERLTDQLKEQADSHEALREEIDKYKAKVFEQQNELDSFVSTYQAAEVHNKELRERLEHLQKDDGSTADAKELQNVIAERNKEIEEYQRQNLQLQMLSSAGQAANFDLLASQPKDQEDQAALQDALKKITEFEEKELHYQSQIADLEKQLRELENAKQAVDTVQEPVQEEISAESSQSSFLTWPKTEDSDDPFKFVTDTAQGTKPANKEVGKENSVEELLEKIKALQVLLYSVEKEKDDAVLQCHELSNELTRLVYERENKHDSLTSQILKNEDLVDTPQSLAELHNLEFSPTKTIPKEEETENRQPVCEDLVTAKTAYLCFDDEGKATIKEPPASQMDAISAQVLKEEDTLLTPEAMKKLHDVEFEKTKLIVKRDAHTSSKPVEEDKVQAKYAYVCYNPENQGESSKADNVTVNAFGENDDGWGWGPEEAKLEEEHRQHAEIAPQSVGTQIEEMTERILVLELERDRHLEDMRQSQIKSGKLIKKLKELKSSNEQLKSQLSLQSSDFPGLDDTIQEEFKLQIDSLEKRVKEINAELAKERVEKENLKKRVDVLTAANERMVEMKEKQDMEILSWQQRSNDLTRKLQQFDWGDDGFEPPKPHPVPETSKLDPDSENVQELLQQIEELNNTVKDLSLDNEELQALVEEQRSLRITDVQKKCAELEKSIPEEEYASLLSERNTLKDQLAITVADKKRLQEDLNNLIQKNSALVEEFQLLSVDRQKLDALVVERNEIELNLRKLQSEHDELVQDREKYQQPNEELLQKLKGLEETNNFLQNQLQETQNLNDNVAQLNDEVKQLKEQIDTVNEEKTVLYKQLQEKDTEIKELNDSINAQITLLRNELEEQGKVIQALTNENLALSSQVKAKEEEVAKLNDKCEKMDEEFQLKLSVTLEQLTEEWTQRVDQRGSDVAESWKLHLESRENEFMQVEQQLRKEVNEAEEKCNALVNENNELRRNVDVEIRNEVDILSALQQQINDKQQCIVELNQNLQDKQNIIDRLESQLEEMVGNITQLQSKLQSNELKITDFETTFVIKQEELDERHRAVEELNRRLENLSTAAGELSEQQKTIDELSRRLEESERNNKHLLELEIQLRDSETLLTALREELAEREILLTESSIAVENYKLKLLEFNQTHGVLQQKLEENDTLISELTERLQSKGEREGSDMVALHQQIYDNENQIATLNMHLQEKQSHVDQLSNEIQSCHQFMQNNEVTISQLNAYIDEVKLQSEQVLQAKSQELEGVLNERLQEITVLTHRLAETESRCEELLKAKDVEIETPKLLLEEQTEIYNKLMSENEEIRNSLQDKLDEKTIECETLDENLREQNTLNEEESKQLSDVRNIIEDQVLKIEELKKELFEKSNDYDALIAELDMYQQPMQEKEEPHTEESHSQRQVASPSIYHETEEDNLLEPVSRAELDLALYMLHQRDVRCEELTMELMQLLEERDTLQLRLSNAIREKEELRGASSKSEAEQSPEKLDSSSVSMKTGAVPKSRASEIVLSATGTELATEASENLNQARGSERLAHKLSELKTVGYRKDKTLVDEQEFRRLQELSIMQQHRDVASRLPPEAAARLMDANYTLSRDVQSPSKVLLNWLWGRSTPKVNDV